ncbi:hypothetical protein QLX08_006690 [Tetragonisca angustula]|uniref:Uncharacterized protein n=1 Tax=Tetragonisca angustula TaxID=166442 RepID=A0AAW0ZT09_9HYME
MIDSETSNRNPASTVDVAQIGKRIGMIRGRGMDEAQRRHKGDENDGGKKRRKIEEGFRGGEGHLWNSAIPLLLHQRRLENSFAESLGRKWLLRHNQPETVKRNGGRLSFYR